MEKHNIGPDFYFKTNGKLTIELSNKAFKKYADGIEDAINLKGSLPIILDTNILLDYYGMSQKEKEKLIKIIEAHKSRIFITKQVEQEYLKNRLSVIKKDFFDPIKKIAPDFRDLQTDILNKFKSYKDDKRRLLSEDYSETWKELEIIEKKLNTVINNDKFLNAIKSETLITEFNNKNISVQDKMLELASTLKVTDSLEISEIDFLKNQYDLLTKEFESARETIKGMYAFPGCGDNKEDPTGDFIIFHEILKFMKEKNTSCIFLTNDVTKGDWLQHDRKPHLHYLENEYFHTKNIIYIVHAKQTFPNISFENIHNNKLEIISAFYGNSLAKIDVAAILRQQTVGNILKVTANNEIAGDPAPGTIKTLEINFKLGDQRHVLAVMEGASFVIPDDLHIDEG